MNKLLCFIFVFVVSHLSVAFDSETVIYKDIPVVIPMHLNEERVLIFSSDVQVWIPNHLSNKIYAESLSNKVYLKIKNPIRKARIKVRTLDKEEYYLLDLIFDEQSIELSEIVEIHHQKNLELTKKSTQTEKTKLDPRLYLIRYAAQQLYTPMRLLKSNPRIQKVIVDTTKEVPLIRGGEVKVTPISQWKQIGGSLYVIAYRVENKTNKLISFDHSKDIRGNYVASAFQHLEIAPNHEALSRKDQSNVTALYIVKNNPIGGILHGF